MSTITLNTSAPSTDTYLEVLAEAALVADMQAKEAAEKAKELKDELKSALEAAGKLSGNTKQVGIVRTVVKQVRRFDPTIAAQLLTKEEARQYSKIDSALVKKNVTPDTYELMQRSHGFSLELKVAD